MYSRLHNFLHKHDILYKYQFGFRKSYSTSLSIELLDTLYLHRNNEKELSVGPIYFDLTKAFDTVDRNISLHKLSDGLHVLNWFKSYLSNRQQQILNYWIFLVGTARFRVRSSVFVISRVNNDVQKQLYWLHSEIVCWWHQLKCLFMVTMYEMHIVKPTQQY